MRLMHDGWAVVRGFLGATLLMIGLRFALPPDVFVGAAWDVMEAIMREEAWGWAFLAAGGAGAALTLMGRRARVAGCAILAAAHLMTAVMTVLAAPYALAPWLLLSIGILAMMALSDALRQASTIAPLSPGARASGHGG